MGKGKSSFGVASRLRRWIHTGQWPPGEIRDIWELRRELDAQAYSIRTALTVLEVEGLVEGLHGVGYRANAPLRSAAFDDLTWRLAETEGEAFVDLVRQLLDFRTLQSVALADSLASRAIKIQEAAHFELLELGGEKRAPRIMDCEEWFFGFLLGSSDRIPEVLAAHQLRRVFLTLHGLLDLGFYMDPPNVQRFTLLIRAIESGDCASARELARAAATFRDGLYLELAGARFQLGNASLGAEGGQG